MADVMKTCANCGNTQEAGDFCEKCGTRFAPSAAEEAAPAGDATYQAPPAPGTYQPGAYQPGAPPPYAYAPQQQYTPPREPGPWGKLFDLSFQGFLTPATLKVLYFITLGLIGAFVVLSIIWGFMFTSEIGAVWLFCALAISALQFFMTRILFELVATVLRMRDAAEGSADKET